MNFKVKITTLTSLFIGNGESYYPTDYFIDEKGKTLNFINKSDYMDKIYGGFYYRALLSLTSSGTFDFKQLMNIYSQSCTDFVEYKIPIDDSDADAPESAFNYLDKNIKEPFRAPVDCFIRGGLDKQPYIPGSSFKGALKNAFQSYMLDNNENTAANIKKELLEVERSFSRETDLKKKETRTINEKIKIVDKYIKENITGSFESDIFRLINVSDFKLSAGDTQNNNLNYIKIIRPNNLNKSGNVTHMPVLLESISKNTSFEGEIYIDDQFIKSNFADRMPLLFNIGIPKEKPENTLKELLMKAIQKFGSQIYDIESKRFKYAENFKFELDKNKNILKLGRLGGGGSKSLDKIREITIQKNGKIITNKAAYQSSLWINENKEPIGWIEVEFL
ncbi:MAG: type III-A CRISPR-associated RAMP protein Csm5 [Candidatus Acididesulfobacter guangdongensis]|uniref:CRISPR system Cms protein Csm5 n=1 Tax=Acididesulfobacter guangdongensis TaxID=2597225 RepID=A0A519BIS0_ACIG2|nr:MAG: type III-A CRISPR-associated RAMP protein Csm5 [Candidatus Acididesulfobacter guangdongensis]